MGIKGVTLSGNSENLFVGGQSGNFLESYAKHFVSIFHSFFTETLSPLPLETFHQSPLSNITAKINSTTGEKTEGQRRGMGVVAMTV